MDVIYNKERDIFVPTFKKKPVIFCQDFVRQSTDLRKYRQRKRKLFLASGFKLGFRR